VILAVRPLLHNLFAPAIKLAASLSYRDAETIESKQTVDIPLNGSS